MIPEHVAGVILAAGKGTRMHSARPKVLFELLSEPMLWYLYQALDPVFPQRLWTVIGHEAEFVRSTFPERDESGFVVQEQQLGTGHALQVAWRYLRDSGMRKVLVVNGDTPLFPAERAEEFLLACDMEDAALGFITLTLDDPGAFGRVVRRNGEISAIVEAKDYDVAEHGHETGEINAGIYFIDMDRMEPFLDRLRNDNNSGEFYITDLVGLAVEGGFKVIGYDCGNDRNLLGINSPAELVEGRGTAAREHRGILASATGLHPTAGQCAYRPPGGAGSRCVPDRPLRAVRRVQGGVGVRDPVPHGSWKTPFLLRGALVKAFSHVQDAQVGVNCQVGPYARLRPGAVLHEDSRVGNFVELKKAVLGKGAKASHLTYLGDAEVGEGCNIGAGTITCNYDGRNKHKTVIGRKAFIGSNTSLVAPVNIGEGALVGAGSTITHDVPENALAIARARQMNRQRKPGS